MRRNSAIANILFYLVLGGYVFGTFIIALTLGMEFPAQSQAEASMTTLFSIIAGVVQVGAFYKAGAESAQAHRWTVAVIMIVLTIISMLIAINMPTTATYISTGDLTATFICAVVSCGALIWLRRNPAIRH